MTKQPKDTPRPKPAASTIPSDEELKKFLNFNATTFDESLANYNAMTTDELWRQVGIAACEFVRCEGLRRLQETDSLYVEDKNNDPDLVAEIKKQLTEELLRRGIGPQAIDEYCAKALSEKKEADLRTITMAKDGPFSHSGDYRSVTIRGEAYTLTSQQARMVEILHLAFINKMPDVIIRRMLETLANERLSPGEKPRSIERWQDSWKGENNRGARHALIKTGARQGTLALNI
jgi:hypothetical protein